MFRRNGLLVPDGDVDALFGILPLVGHFQVDHVEEEVAITLIHAGFYRFNYRLILLLRGGFVVEVPVTHIRAGSHHWTTIPDFFLG